MILKILKIALSFLIIIFSVILGLYFGTINASNFKADNGQKNNQQKDIYFFPAPAIINLKNGDIVRGKEEILIFAPGSVALRLSAHTMEGDIVTEAEIPKNGSVTKFAWNTSEYVDGAYYFNLVVYYLGGAPSNITKFLTIDNSSLIGLREKTVDENLLVEKIRLNTNNEVILSGFALGQRSEVYLNSILDKRQSQVFPDQNGYWQLKLNIGEGRHIFELEEGDQKSYGAEFYFSGDELLVIDPPNKEEIKKEVTKYGLLGGGIGGLMVSFSWLLGIIFAKKRRSYED
jgi:hypothetical protein